MTIKEFLTQDHKECDEVFALVEADFAVAKEKFEEMAGRFEKHFQMEEEVFFPQFEEKTGMMGGPTQIMRMEHSQMRGLIAQMRDAVEKDDEDKFLSLAETFLFLVQQHNSKEEQILYAMADQALNADELIPQMKEV